MATVLSDPRGIMQSQPKRPPHRLQSAGGVANLREQADMTERTQATAADDSADLKVCTKCKIGKPLDQFSRNNRNKCGRVPRCKDCVRAYYLANRERVLEQCAEYRAANQDRIVAYRRQYKEKHRKELAAKQREYRAANPEVRAEWNRKNREARAAYMANWRAENRDAIKEYRDAWRAANADRYQMYDAVRRGRLEESGVDPEVSIATLRDRDGDRCCYCQTPLRFCGDAYAPNRVNLEHITPVSRGGSHTFDNAALACRACNQSKNAKLFIWEWV